LAFNVDTNGVLQPLGVKVLRGVEFIRNTREYSDKVPGRDGEIYFGSEFEAGLISLPCFVVTTPSTWGAKEDEIMGYLNPKLGTQVLTFANRPGKFYNVVYSGQLRQTEEGPGYRKFTITFKYFEGHGLASSLSTLVGAGTAVNSGNDETPCTIEIVGAVTNPSVTIGANTLTYTGALTASDTLIIDTEKLTATFNGANALANYNAVFPNLAVGDNIVTVTGGTVTLSWLDRWL
jgi:phage-related protein